MADDVKGRPGRYPTAGLYAVAAAALAGLVWRPDAYWPAAVLLLVVPTVWRAIGFPIWHLAVMEGVALLATLALRAYCGSSGCGIDYRHPWHFLPDLTLAFLVAAPIGLGLAAMAPLARWVRERDRPTATAPRLLRMGLLAAASIGLAFVFWIVSPFVPMMHADMLFLILTWGVPLSMAAAIGFALRSWVPALAAIAVVFAVNVDAVASCEADADESTECNLPYFMEPQREPFAHGAFAIFAVGAAFWGSRRAKLGLPLVAMPRNPRVPR